MRPDLETPVAGCGRATPRTARRRGQLAVIAGGRVSRSSPQRIASGCTWRLDDTGIAGNRRRGTHRPRSSARHPAGRRAGRCWSAPEKQPASSKTTAGHSCGRQAGARGPWLLHWSAPATASRGDVGPRPAGRSGQRPAAVGRLVVQRQGNAFSGLCQDVAAVRCARRIVINAQHARLELHHLSGGRRSSARSRRVQRQQEQVCGAIAATLLGGDRSVGPSQTGRAGSGASCGTLQLASATEITRGGQQNKENVCSCQLIFADGGRHIAYGLQTVPAPSDFGSTDLQRAFRSGCHDEVSSRQRDVPNGANARLVSRPCPHGI